MKAFIFWYAAFAANVGLAGLGWCAAVWIDTTIRAVARARKPLSIPRARLLT